MARKLGYSVPLEALDQFYFEQVVGQMPAPLQKLATDLRVLRGETTEIHIDTLNDLYPTNDCLFVPWLLDDIFDLSVEVRLGLGQAWLLLLIACVLLDRMIGGDTPALPTVPLVQKYLLRQARQAFQRQFNSPGSFWDQYDDCLAEFEQALAIESDCLDAHTQPYTYELMAQVCAGKAAPLRLVVYALALSSGYLEPLGVLNSACNKLLLVDQLVDDALDWREDLQDGRFTLCGIWALEAEGDSLEAVSELSVNELDDRIARHGILVDMVKQAVLLLEQVQTDLSEAHLESTKLYAFFDKRLDVTRSYQRYYQAIQLVGGLTKLLAKNPHQSTSMTTL